jgi:hypothetical protein
MHPAIHKGALVFFVTATSCDGPAQDQGKTAQEEEVAQREADEAEKKAQAERRVREREQAEAEAERAYAEAKIELEPLATLPKKRPKGFAGACDAWLVTHDAFMQKTLEGDRLTAWTSNHESRVPRLRRECHERSVEAVVCQTQLLKTAAEGTNIDHIMRICQEKF